MPWLVAIAVETLGLRGVFRADLAARLASRPETGERLPVFATTVVAVTVVGFAVASPLGIAPVWVATAGAVVLSAYRLVRRRTTVVAVVRSAAPSFCLFVLGLGIVVRAVSEDGLGRVVQSLGAVRDPGCSRCSVWRRSSAVLANVMNNLPATLLLLPIAAAGGVGPALAVLVGVDIGPNLTYAGSLATLLWRRAVSDVDGVPEVGDFVRLGPLTVPLAIVGVDGGVVAVAEGVRGGLTRDSTGARSDMVASASRSCWQAALFGSRCAKWSPRETSSRLSSPAVGRRLDVDLALASSGTTVALRVDQDRPDSGRQQLDRVRDRDTARASSRASRRRALRLRHGRPCFLRRASARRHRPAEPRAPAAGRRVVSRCARRQAVARGQPGRKVAAGGVADDGDPARGRPGRRTRRRGGGRRPRRRR